MIAYSPGGTAVNAMILKCNATLNGITAQANTQVTTAFGQDVALVLAKSAKINWFGAVSEQVVIGAAAPTGAEGSVWIYSFNQDLQFLQDVAKFPVAPPDAQFLDLALWNFAKSGEPDLRVAALFAEPSARG